MPIRPQLTGIGRAAQAAGAELMEFNIESKLYKILDELGAEYVREMRDVLKSTDKVATGKLYDSIKYEVLPEKDKYVLLCYAEDYLEYVINGRRPGSKPPPYKVLLPWMAARGMKPSVGGAIAIARSIGKKGIRPQPRIGQTLNSIFSKTTADKVAEAAKLDMEQVIGRYIAMGFFTKT